MNTNLDHSSDTSLIIMKTMEQGFNAILNQQAKQANQIANLEKELKTTTKASYQAQTKEGKDRYLASLKEGGKTSQEIANILDIKTVSYVERRIRQAKRNGK